MWTFQQSTGQVLDPCNMLRGRSYAGRGKGKNNPAMQDVHAGCRWISGVWVPVDGLTPDDWGPLPCGLFVMNTPIDSPKHGKFVIWLTPDPKNEMFGRSGFGWHGDSIEHPGLASEGCVCSPRILRQLGWDSGDRDFQVIP